VPYADTYDVYRTVGGASQGKLVGATAGLTSDDTGLGGDATTAPTVNTSGVTNATWQDAELLDLATKGTTDLWAGILDLFQEHFLTVDATNVSLAAGGSSLTGVPADVFRVHLIEPRDTTSMGNGRNVAFVPRDYNSAEFIEARTQTSFDPTGDIIIYYCITGAGAPNAAPTVLTAPLISSALNLRFVYVPTLGVSSYLTTTNNPIPGESDNALVAWTVAYAYAKTQADKTPHAGWLSIYGIEKQSLLTRLTPRQTQEPQVVDGLFDAFWY
jgi:hypothetical protein